ncbi:MAG: hypothetical protein ABDH28_07570 [Brevinematia bacterium]
MLSKVSNLVVNLNYQGAIIELEKAISKKPNDINYYTVLIDLCLKSDEVEIAERYVKKALSYEKNNLLINSYLMEINRLKGNLEESKKIAEKLLKNPEARTNIVFVVMFSRLLANIDLKEAEKFLDLHIRTFHNYELLVEMAKVQLELGKLQKAKEFLDKSISLERFDRRVYSLYGEYYFKTRKYEESIKNLEKAILFPGNRNKEYYLLSQSYYNIRNYEKSLEFLGKLNLREEVTAKVLFVSGKYQEVVKRFSKSESEITRYFVEESVIKLSHSELSKDRKNLSETRLKASKELKKKGIPYYELYLRRAIRLNPLNYDAWFELGNYYKFYHSPYVALEELEIAKNLFVNDAKMQDFFESISDYILNTSKLSSWNIATEKQKNAKLLIDIEPSNLPIEKDFYQNATIWAIESFKLINTTTEVSTENVSPLSYRNYDLVVKVKQDVVKDYMILELSFLDPLTYNTLTNATVSQKFSDNFVSEIYYNFKTKMTALLPSYGVIEGIKDNLIVARFSNKPPKAGDKVSITSNDTKSLIANKYITIATGNVTDTEGEYALIELDKDFKHLVTIKKGYKVIKN